MDLVLERDQWQPLDLTRLLGIAIGLVTALGHVRGAFIGSVTRSTGRFERANRGTLFLDEIGDLPLELQPKLLRVIQERQFERLGSTATIHADVRVICATHGNLVEMIESREFRADLVFPVELPPLRERPEDIRLLVRHFAMNYARRMRTDYRDCRGVHHGVCALYLAGQYPGVAKLHRAFGNPLQRSCANRFAVGSDVRAEGFLACHAGRSGEFTHSADSPANGRGGGWSEWRRRSPGPAPDDVDLQDAAARSQPRAKLSVAGASSSVGPKFRGPNSSDASADCNRSRGCKFRKLQSALWRRKSVRGGQSLTPRGQISRRTSLRRCGREYRPAALVG
jgi:hypothetical protein